MLELTKQWNIVTAFAETAKGSGWQNEVIWVVVQRAGTNEYSLECIQPEEQTLEMKALFKTSEACSDAMVNAVSNVMLRKLC